jgi:hypothetical protein
MKLNTRTSVMAIAALTLMTGFAAKQANAQAFTDGNFGGAAPAPYTLVGWQETLVSTPPGVGLSLKVSDNESLDGLNDYANVHFNTGGTNPGSTLSQTFDTVASSLYTVSYQFGEYTTTSAPTSQTMTVSIDGTTEQTETVSGSSVGVVEGVPNGLYTFTFVAPTASSTILFTDAGSTGTTSSDGIIENVSVIGPAPEAATWIGGGLAALLMLGLSFRSRKQNTSAMVA